jgi:hypothetical protein
LRQRGAGAVGYNKVVKYFTPDLLNRVRSQDEDVSADAHDEWEKAIQRSERRWRKIKGAFPKSVRRFDADYVCLHDADVLRMGRTKDTFIFFLETEPPASRPVVLTFTLDGEPAIETGTLLHARQGIPVHWLYEEWDVDRRQRLTFEVLLSNGWVIKLPFRDFHYLIADPIAPTANGEVARPVLQATS